METLFSQRSRRFAVVIVFAILFTALISIIRPSPALAACNFFGNFHNAQVNLPGAMTGARARIGHPGSVPYSICNTVKGSAPISGHFVWSMMEQNSCSPGGYFQTGYIRNNLDMPNASAEFFFAEYSNCTDPGYVRVYATPANPLGGTSYCYTATFSGLLGKWVNNIATSCGGTTLVEWQWPAYLITIAADKTVWSGEVWDYLQAPGANSTNSDSMCGFSTNKCTFSQTQYRNLSGAWINGSISSGNTYFTPGGHCGYGQVVNNSTSFAIWTNFTGC